MNLVVIGSQQRFHQVDVGRQDAILIDIGHALQTIVEFKTSIGDQPVTIAIDIRIKLRFEEAHDSADHIGVARKGLDDIVLAVAKTDLF